MQFQRDEIIRKLPEYGWNLVEIEIPNREIWYQDAVDEVLTIESVWRPIGFRAKILFLVAPWSEPERKKGEQVWAIEVSSGEDCNEFRLQKGHWQETLKDIFAQLAKSRQRGLT